ncbi:MAG: enoyl-CoA hydratase [Solirubrobacterales bacterium]|nr:enoyl-CoA hydratase [Solirubrobacterales bacterium]MBV9715497.1 enoyl-CoA hydratase [Solirubrobacterales bacterium]
MGLELETVELEVTDRVAWITLNRPEALNAWTRRLGQDMLTALEHAAAEPLIRAVVFTGAGRAFSSGADLKAAGEVQPGADGGTDVEGLLRDVHHPLILRVRTVPKPVIAAVNGPAVGIGCSLALACDLVLACESAYFLLAFVNIGLGLDGGASMLVPARVGHARAFEMAYLGERLPAARALEWGLVNRVLADGEFAPAVRALAVRLAAGPPGSYAAIKRTINQGLYERFEEVLSLEARLQQERVESKDFGEGVAAFAQKRSPEFTGE